MRGDPGRPIPTFVAPELRKVKVADVDDPDYVPGASCHVVISKQEIAKGTDAGRNRMAIERSRGISRGLIRDFLAQLLARYASEHPEKFTATKKIQKKNQVPEQITYRPTVYLHPQKNADLKRDLNDGKIGGFRLTRGTADFSGEASAPKIQRMNVQLQAKIAPTEDLGQVRKLVSSIQEALGPVDFEALNLELVDDNGEEVSSTQSIKITNLDNEDFRYCKKVPVPAVSAGAEECYAKFHPPLRNFIKGCLSENKYWN